MLIILTAKLSKCFEAPVESVRVGQGCRLSRGLKEPPGNPGSGVL